MAADSKLIKNDQILKPKMAKQIKAAIRSYENKRYKIGLKECGVVLKAHPHNAEAIAIRGIIKYAQGETELGLAEVKRALKLNIRSSTCWHIYAILYKLKHDYQTAIKGYINAKRLNKKNALLHRDLTILHLQVGDYSSFQKYSFEFLSMQPSNKNHWISCLIASYLNGVSIKTKMIYKTYLTTLDPNKEKSYELNELVLFGAKVYKEVEDTQKYLSFLQINEHFVLDKSFWLLEKAKALIALGEVGNGRDLLVELIQNDSENFEAHADLCLTFGFDLKNGNFIEESAENYNELKLLYENFEKRSNLLTINCCRLKILRGSDFEICFAHFIGERLRKSANLFSAVKELTKDKTKDSFIKRHIIEVKQNALKQFEAEDSGENHKFLGNCLAFELALYIYQHDYKAALFLVGSECGSFKENYALLGLIANLFGKLGRFEESLRYRKAVYELMPGDRHSNSELTKALLKNDCEKEALETFYRFLTKKDQNLKFLEENHIIWIFKALGKFYFRKKDYKNALKYFAAILSFFSNHLEDQLDFHSYCTFKGLINTHLEMLLENRNRFKSRLFETSAMKSIKCLLELKESAPDEETKLKLLDNAQKICKQLETNGNSGINSLKLIIRVNIEREKFSAAARFIRIALEKQGESYKLWSVLARAKLAFAEFLDSDKLSAAEKAFISAFSQKYLPQDPNTFYNKILMETKSAKELKEAIKSHSVLFKDKVFGIEQFGGKIHVSNTNKGQKIENKLRVLLGGHTDVEAIFKVTDFGQNRSEN